MPPLANEPLSNRDALWRSVQALDAPSPVTTKSTREVRTFGSNAGLSGLAGAFARLGMMTKANGIAVDYRRNLRYEKPTTKRRRLSSSRHRRRFQAVVGDLVAVTMRAKRRGL